MKMDNLEKYIKEVSNGTIFNIEADRAGRGEIQLAVRGDRPFSGYWCHMCFIRNPKIKRELIAAVHEKFQFIYDHFDVDDYAYGELAAKRNGVSDIPGAGELVHNAEWQKNAWKEFTEKLSGLC